MQHNRFGDIVRVSFSLITRYVLDTYNDEEIRGARNNCIVICLGLVCMSILLTLITSIVYPMYFLRC